MKTNFYLVVNSKGDTKTCKTSPNLKRDEMSIALTLDLPDRLFMKPYLSGTIVIPDDAVESTVITPEITNNIESAIKEHSGVDVKLSIQEPIFFEINEVDALKLKVGDRVRCTFSAVKGRVGKEWTVSRGKVNEKEVPLYWLKHCGSYGDVFEKIED